MIIEMPEHVTSVRIKAALPDVFSMISNPEQSARCLSRVRRVERLGDTSQGLNASYREWRVLENGSEIVQDFHVVEYVPEKRCTLASTSNGVRFMFTASFVHASGETVVTIRSSAHGVTMAAKLLLPFVWMFVGPSAKKALFEDLEELKTCLELSAAGASPNQAARR